MYNFSSPDFLFGLIVGAALAVILFLAFLSLLGFLEESADRRRNNPLDQVEHFQRIGEDLRYGADRTTPPPAANEATLDLRDAYRRPRSAVAEMRGGPR